MPKIQFFSILASVIFITGCETISHRQNEISLLVKDFFEVYAQRQDLDRLMSFYADDAQLNDIVYGSVSNDKDDIRRFLAWDQGGFRLVEGSRILTVKSQIVANRTAVTEGVFHAFYYNEEKLGPWLFVIVHEFDSDDKIIRQTDWINYTPRLKFLDGLDMNERLIK